MYEDFAQVELEFSSGLVLSAGARPAYCKFLRGKLASQTTFLVPSALDCLGLSVSIFVLVHRLRFLYFCDTFQCIKVNVDGLSFLHFVDGSLLIIVSLSDCA